MNELKQTYSYDYMHYGIVPKHRKGRPVFPKYVPAWMLEPDEHDASAFAKSSVSAPAVEAFASDTKDADPISSCLHDFSSTMDATAKYESLDVFVQASPAGSPHLFDSSNCNPEHNDSVLNDACKVDEKSECVIEAITDSYDCSHNISFVKSSAESSGQNIDDFAHTDNSFIAITGEAELISDDKSDDGN